MKYTIPQLACIEAGPKSSAVSIIFLHGWLDNAASFQSVIEAFHARMPDAYLCAIDLPGHGLSPYKSSDNFYTFHDYIYDLHEFISSLSHKKHILVGHSLGGFIASCYCAAFPEKVHALLQIEGIGPLYESADHCVERIRDGVLSRPRVVRKLIKGYGTFADALNHRANNSGLDEALVLPIVERGLENNYDIWHWRADIKLYNQSLYRMTEAQAQQIVSAIRCPYTVLLGDHGYADIQEKIETMLPSHADSFVIPGGHHCHLESVDDVVSHMLKLVDRCELST